MTWRVAKAILTLRSEVDAAHRGRPTAADGTIGDAAHQAQQSDHNPNSAGVVTAWDITYAPFSNDLAETLRVMGKAGDRRVKYVIWNRRIASAVQNWTWRPYSGPDPHTSHIHLSVSGDPVQYDRVDPWLTHTGAGRIPPTSFPPPPVEEEDMTPAQAEQLQRIEDKLDALTAPRRSDHTDPDPQHVSLGDVLTEVDSKAGK